MTYIKDLDVCKYSEKDSNRLAVGWLDIEYPFPTGKTEDEFKQKLSLLIQNRVFLFRGSHACQFCQNPDKTRMHPHSGNGSIVVGSTQKDVVYEAPVLIYHYVVDHNYLPPTDFIDSVLGSY